MVCLQKQRIRIFCDDHHYSGRLFSKEQYPHKNRDDIYDDPEKPLLSVTGDLHDQSCHGKNGRHGVNQSRLASDMSRGSAKSVRICSILLEVERGCCFQMHVPFRPIPVCVRQCFGWTARNRSLGDCSVW